MPAALYISEGSGSSRHMRQMLELALCKCLRKSHRCREALVLATEVSQALDKSLGRLNEWSVDAKRLQGVLSSTVASHVRALDLTHSNSMSCSRLEAYDRTGRRPPLYGSRSTFDTWLL